MSRSQPASFTITPNEIIDNLTTLDGFDKQVYTILVRFNPSFPSLQSIMARTGWSKGRILKSLKKLEGSGCITRYKIGRKIQYLITGISSPGELIEGAQSVHYMHPIGSPGVPITVHQVNTNKTKEIKLKNNENEKNPDCISPEKGKPETKKIIAPKANATIKTLKTDRFSEEIKNLLLYDREDRVVEALEKASKDEFPTGVDLYVEYCLRKQITPYCSILDLAPHYVKLFAKPSSSVPLKNRDYTEDDIPF